MSLVTTGYINGAPASGSPIQADFTTASGSLDVTLSTPYWPIAVVANITREAFLTNLPFFVPAGTCLRLPTAEALALVAANATSKF
jgi:hypothetical protein